MRKIIVTGAGGFIGRCLVRELLNSGYKVWAVYRSLPKNDVFKSFKNYIPVVCDLNSPQWIYSLAEQTPPQHLTRWFNTLYHCAWAGTSGKDRTDHNIQMNNIRMSLNVISSLRDAKEDSYTIDTFINIGTFSQYGATSNVSCASSNIYGRAKLTADEWMRGIASEDNWVQYVSVLLTNVYGPSEGNTNRLISTVIRELTTNGVFTMNTDGDILYDFVYETDAAKALIQIMNYSDTFNRKSVLLCSHKMKTLREYITTLQKTLYPDAIVSWGTRTEISLLNTSQAMNDRHRFLRIGFKHHVSFETGIRKVQEAICPTPSKKHTICTTLASLGAFVSNLFK